MKLTVPILGTALLISGLTSCRNCQPRPAENNILASDADSKARLDLAAIGSAISQFQLRNGATSPSNLKFLVEMDANGKRYFRDPELPLDAYGHEYLYSQDEQGQEWELWFLGKDGARGGEGADADISAAQVESGN